MKGKNMKTSNSHNYEYSVFKEIKPSFAYDGKEDFEKWQSRAKDKLCELLGLPLGICSATMNIEHKKEEREYNEYRFTVETEPDYLVPCYLRIPKTEDKKIPLTICLSGHGGGMHVALGIAKCDSDEKALKSWHHRAMAIRSINEGRAALVIEARNFGESSLEGYGTSCTEAAKIAILSGRTVIGERVWDAMRVLDAIAENFNEIDMTDIICTGNSGGGTATYYLACLDERITVAAPSCAVCSFEQSIAAMEHCMCNHIPGIKKYFEMADLGGLIAPRRLVIAAGREDDIFPIKGTEDAFAKIFAMYLKAGVPERCALVIGDGGHLNYADLLWEKIHEMGV